MFRIKIVEPKTKDFETIVTENNLTGSLILAPTYFLSDLKAEDEQTAEMKKLVWKNLTALILY